MYSWKNFIDKYRRNWDLKGSEIRGLIITLIVLSFIFSFREWGTTSFDWGMGIGNYFRAIMLVGMALLAHEFGHRTIATWLGYSSQYKTWILGLIAGLVITFVSNGYLLFLAPGIMIIHFSKVHRLGTYPYGPNMNHIGWIAMSGAVANMLLAIILKSIYFAAPHPWLLKAVNINIWLALFNMMPIPPFNGLKAFYGSKFVYVFVLGAMIGAAVIMTWAANLWTVLGALVIGAALLFIFFTMIERPEKVFR